MKSFSGNKQIYNTLMNIHNKTWLRVKRFSGYCQWCP